MKKLVVLIIAVIITAAAFAQNKNEQKKDNGAPDGQPFKKGQTDLNFGLGLGNRIVRGGAASEFPLLGLSLDYGVTDDISIGGYLGYTGASYSYSSTELCGSLFNWSLKSYTDTYRWSYFIVGARGSYHFNKFIKVNKLDTYAGLMLGNNFAHYKFSTTSTCLIHYHAKYSSRTYGGGFAYAFFAGARYKFNEHFGVFGELGFGVSILNMGVNYKL